MRVKQMAQVKAKATGKSAKKSVRKQANAKPGKRKATSSLSVSPIPFVRFFLCATFML
jgi:hypothetical protein